MYVPIDNNVNMNILHDSDYMYFLIRIQVEISQVQLVR